LYFPIPDTIAAGGRLTVELTYVEFLPYAMGRVTYTYPSDYHLIQSEAIGRQLFEFTLASQRAIDSIRVTSSHTVAMQNNYRDSAKVRIDLQQSPAVQNYSLQYVLNSTQLGLFAYSTKLPGAQVPDSLGNGFLTFIAEPDPGTTTATIAKVFTLIVDRSGSMSGTKMTQAQNAARFIVQNLNQDDKFNIIDFDDVITSFRPGHVPLTATSRDSALLYINTLTARNNTSISGAFAMAIPQFNAASSTSANIIIFLTDGQPTAGITGITQLVQYVDNLISANQRNINLFSFGIGSDANVQLLTLLSSHSKGIAQFLGNDELYSSITNFYLTIRNPVLLNSSVTFSPAAVTQVYPDSLPNLYKGQQMIVAGRYKQAQTVRITLSGTAFGNPVAYTYDVPLSDSSNTSNQFLPKIWAKRKIESLLIRYYMAATGSAQAISVKAEIVALSQLYGIITTFTSFTGTGATGVTAESATRMVAPTAFDLMGNYPNPFNPSTTIKLNIRAALSGPLEIRIYDILGRIVRTLTMHIGGAGEYEIVWNGRDDNSAVVPSGVYFYGVEFSDTIVMGKMTLLK
jgi:Ca-activated chloride channel family protein